MTNESKNWRGNPFEKSDRSNPFVPTRWDVGLVKKEWRIDSKVKEKNECGSARSNYGRQKIYLWMSASIVDLQLGSV